jgi:tetratricopeptide (TPR) repeat protein
MVKNKPNLLNTGIFNLLMELLLLAALFFIAVIFDRRLGIVFSGTKIAWLRSVVIVFLSLWSIKIIVTRQHPFIRTILDWPVMTFLLCTTVAAFTSVHVYTSLAGFYGRYEGLTTWYIYGILFFVVTNYIKRVDQWEKIIMVVLPASTLMSIYSIIQRQAWDPYMWGGVPTKERVIGMIGQPNFLAAYILMAFFMILGLFLMRDRGVKRASKTTKVPVQEWLPQLLPGLYLLLIHIIFLFMIYNLEAYDVLIWYLGFVVMTVLAVLFALTFHALHPQVLNAVFVLSLLLNYICILYTQSRGGYVGLFTAAALFALVAGRQLIFAGWKKILVVTGLIVLVTAITMAQPGYSPFARFSDEISTKKVEKKAVEKAVQRKLELKGAAGSRGETWKSAFGVIADNPVFGVGPEVLKMVFPRYETDLFRFKETFHVKQDRCHNETFDVSVTKGLIAFAIYLWILFLFFNTGWKKALAFQTDNRLLLAGFLAAALAYLIQNQFSFGVVAITSLFWIIWGMVAGMGKEEEGKEKEREATLDWADVPWLPVAGIVVAAGVLIYFSFLSFRGDVLFKTGKTYLETQRFSPAVEQFEGSLDVYPLEGGTISHLAIAYLNLSNTTPDKAGALQKAIAALNYGTKVDPYNADNFFMLARIYFITGDLKQARNYADTALIIDPYYAEVHHLLGMICEKEGNKQKAIEHYKRAVQLNPTLDQPIQSLSNVTRSGDVLAVLEDTVDKYGYNPVILEKLARLYLSTGQKQKAQETAERIIELLPAGTTGYLLRDEARK